MSYDYNLDGSLNIRHYPSGAAVTYTLLSAGGLTAGRMLSAVDSGHGINYATGAAHVPDGSLSSFVSGGTVTNSFSYNKRLQPINMSATTSGQTVFSIGYDFHVGAGDNGNVFGITNYKDNTRNQTFTYDQLNRLLSAQNAGTDCSVIILQNKTKFWGNGYTYDAWGNLTDKGNLPGSSTAKCNPESLHVTADAQNRAHMPVGADFQYDAAGNMTYDAKAAQYYSYDAENRISTANTSLGTESYTYDADGNRVKKVTPPPPATPTSGTLYWYMSPGIVGESDLSGNLTAEYVFFDGERVARKDLPGGAVSYYFSDHLKTTDIVTDAQGNIKNESDFYPWGGELQFLANDSNRYKFTGKERDSESGLDYFGARYYSNGLGRFITPDWSATPVPVPYADFGDPQSLNQYSYVRNIPTSRADLDGHDGPGVKEAVELTAADWALIDAVAPVAATPVGLFAGAVAVTVGAPILLAPKGPPTSDIDIAMSEGWVPPPEPAQTQTQLGHARGADEDKSQSDDAKDKARTNGGLVKDQPATGPGTVPPDQRDPKRLWTKAERQAKLDQQGGKCALCGKKKTVDETQGHHKKRHANGGKTDDANHAEVCKDGCHKELHK